MVSIIEASFNHSIRSNVHEIKVRNFEHGCVKRRVQGYLFYQPSDLKANFTKICNCVI